MASMVDGLSERINRAWRLVLASQIPALQQLLLMRFCPFGHQLLVRPALVLRLVEVHQITIP
jgi:hypothetical protein